MKNYKRLLCLLLACCMIVGLAACGGDPGTSTNDGENGTTTTTVAGADDPLGDDTVNDGESTTTDSGTSATDDQGNPVTGVTNNGGGNNNTGGGNNAGGGKNTTTTTRSSQPTSTKVKDTAVRDLGGRTITFMAIWDTPKRGATERENLWWKKKTEVEKKYNVKFKHVYASGDWYSTYLSSVMAGSPSADVICCKENPMPAIKQGLFYDLGSLDEFDLNESKWIDSVTELGTYNNKQYLALAGSYEPRNLVLYNKDLFKKYSQEDLYTLQKQGKLTLDKLVSIAKNITSKTNKPSIYGGITAFEAHLAFAYAYGGVLVNRTPNTMNFKSQFNTTPVVTGFQKAQELVNQGVMWGETKTSGWTWVREQFYKGNVPICIDYTLESYFVNSNFDVGVCMMPNTKGGTVDVYSDTCWMAISSKTSKPDDVALIMDQMVDVIFDVNYKDRYRDILSDDAMELVNAQAKRQQQGVSKLDYYYLVDLWGDGVGATLNSMVAGTVTPAQAVQTIDGVVNNKMKSF